MADRVKIPYVNGAGGKSFSAKLRQQTEIGDISPELGAKMAERFRAEHLTPQEFQGTHGLNIWRDEAADIDKHIADALLYGQVASRLHRATPQPTLDSFQDYELIMELIKRGYAAMKIPEGRSAPEIFK